MHGRSKLQQVFSTAIVCLCEMRSLQKQMFGCAYVAVQKLPNLDFTSCIIMCSFLRKASFSTPDFVAQSLTSHIEA